MSEWISVKERLPELHCCTYDFVHVIGAIDGNYVKPLIYERTVIRGKVVERWKNEKGSVCGRNVTHWMQYPEPPVTEDKNENQT